MPILGYIFSVIIFIANIKKSVINSGKKEGTDMECEEDDADENNLEEIIAALELRIEVRT